MQRILGIDTGTNSLGWGIVECADDGTMSLGPCGVEIFPEGVNNDKGIESAKATDRTLARGQRRGYYRTRLRKIALLRVLSAADYCPRVPAAALRAWRLGKEYPADDDFRRWLLTDDAAGVNPYAFRYRCLTTTLDVDTQHDRHIIGRALYHIAQRRGFLSNRKEEADDNDTGKVKDAISDLTNDIKAAGCEYLGEYLYTIYGTARIRNRYTARNDHYRAEVEAILLRQHVPHDIGRQVLQAIFYQRPLRSQKHAVGHCTFEPRKPRCPVSHPDYEEFRMLCLLNNVKVRLPLDVDWRPLYDDERKAAIEMFYRKSKAQFDFKDIARAVAGKRHTYGHYKDAPAAEVKFNYHMDQSVSGCPVTTQLRSLFGCADWAAAAAEVYTRARGKTRQQVADDVWHAIFDASDNAYAQQWAQRRLQMSAADAKAFAEIHLPQDYAALSLCAIRKMLPWLRQGYLYSHAVFLANLGEVVPHYEWDNEGMRAVVIEQVSEALATADGRHERLADAVRQCLAQRFPALTDDDFRRLYHPSMIETYPKAQPGADGTLRLGSPRTDTIRNPVVMRSLHNIRRVLNALLAKGEIDADTEVHVEMARDLNDANRRAVIHSENRDNEKARADARRAIMAEGYGEPTDRDLLRYELWQEQEHTCLYTGKPIALVDFLGSNPQFDIEHTVPQSAGGDSERRNLTLCDSRYNRDVKQNRLPAACPNYEEIRERLKPWQERVDDLEKQIRRCRTSPAMAKEQRDTVIQKRHRLTAQCDYWRDKFERFNITEVPQGFCLRQGHGNAQIARTTLAYLRSVFAHVYPRKGLLTAEFRRLWGLQAGGEAKNRESHTHHCADAITIACMDADAANKLAAYYHDKERGARPVFPKPWPAFTEDVRAALDALLVAHTTTDNMPRTGRRRIIAEGRKTLACGDAARGSLHKDTMYGAIESDGQVRYVVRRPLAALATKDIDTIVDPAVREAVKAALAEYGKLAPKELPSGAVRIGGPRGAVVNKVRCYAPNVTTPIALKQQRDASRHEYKRSVYVTNDRNYAMALYIGVDARGKQRREFKLVSTLDAARHFSLSGGVRHEPLVSDVSAKGYPLACTLRIGTMVLLYENSPEEVWNASPREVVRRMYKVTGLSSMTVSGNAYGTIVMTYHKEARQSTELKQKNGRYQSGEELRPVIKMLHTQLNALVEGRDFRLTPLGEVVRINDSEPC